MTVSIIVTIYNTIQYLERCVHSIMSQTFDDYEVLFVDDASTDSSKKLLRTILSEYPSMSNRWTIIENKYNMGVGYCRHVAMKKAKGEYLIHVDSDDYVEITFLEKMVKKAESTQSDIVICNTADVINEKIYVNNIENVTEKDELIKRLLIGTCHNSLWNKLIRRRIFEDNNIYPDDFFRVMEDKSVMFRCVFLANKVTYVNDVLYYYRKADYSLTSGSQKNLLPMLEKLNCIIDEFFKEKEVSDTIKDGIELFKVGMAASILLYGEKNEINNQFIRKTSIKKILSNKYIPFYYQIALICKKYYLNFVVWIFRVALKMKNNDRR